MDYSKMATRTLSIITKRGCAVTLSYFSPGTYNMVEGSYTSSSYTDLGTMAIFDTVTGNPGKQGLTTDALNTILSQKVDCLAHIAASGITTPPSISDRVKRSGEIYEILYCETIKPSTVSLLFTLILRKG